MQKKRLQKSPAPLLPGAFFEDLAWVSVSKLAEFSEEILLIHHGAWWFFYLHVAEKSSRISDTLSRMLGNIYIYNIISTV